MKIAHSPVYLDTSALTKIYVEEPESDALEAALLGRRDLVVSELCITEIASALARRIREGDLSQRHATKVYGQVATDLANGMFLRADISPDIHREAERLLLSVGRETPLRTADALHAAMAVGHGCRAIVTYDQHLRAAIVAIGTLEVLPEEM